MKEYIKKNQLITVENITKEESMRLACCITVGCSINGVHGKPYLLEERDALESKRKRKPLKQ